MSVITGSWPPDLHRALARDLVPLDKIRLMLPGRRHQHPHIQVVQRWARDGIRVAGDRLVLPTVVRAGRRFTTNAAVEWWLDEIDRRRVVPATRRQTIAQRKRAYAKAMNQAQAMGIA